MGFDPKNLKYNVQGLIPCIAQDANTFEVLMMAWMNAEAVSQTISSKKMTYWSRSRGEFWVKGESSGNTQTLVSLRYDCDKDCLLAIVDQNGPACHTNRFSCFYTEISSGKEIELTKPMER